MEALAGRGRSTYGLSRYRIALPVLVLILGACASAPAINPGTVEALQTRIEILETRLLTLEARREQVPMAVAMARAAVAFVWEIRPHVLVYDARTSGGGSGGPVLDRQGRVIGVNAAYLEEFEGGNYGVPIQAGQRLLAGGGQPATAANREQPTLSGETSSGW